MSDDSASAAAPHYRAFISYSHADARFAGWLHRGLEAARLPEGRRLSPVFIDRAELAAGPDLSAQVRVALAQSAALVVVASPAARASRWVGQEIALFRQLHPDRPIFAALIEGEPVEAFPAALLHSGDAEIEPLAADFRKGQDGKRLGLLKIVAGLTAQPLDRLVQRDAQTRQRRVMAVTAGALLLSLILAAALVLAIRARAEAERQRSEAEGLVEFMLTDLRDKLKGVGRLDVMDTVNQRAMARYADPATSSGASDDELRRRVKLFLAMAEDDLSSTTRRAEGRQEATFAMQIADSLMDRAPDDQRNIFLKAQSEYWVGYGYFLQRDKQRALPHWRNYHLLASRMVGLSPKDDTALGELAYAESNLCSLALAAPVEPASALQHCGAAKQISAKQSQSRPNDLQSQIDFLDQTAWMADAQDAAGNSRAALALRSEQADLARQVVTRWPTDLRAREAQMRAELGLAQALRKHGNSEASRQSGQRALKMAAELHRHDPGNRDWIDWREQARKLSN